MNFWQKHSQLSHARMPDFILKWSIESRQFTWGYMMKFPLRKISQVHLTYFFNWINLSSVILSKKSVMPKSKRICIHHLKFIKHSSFGFQDIQFYCKMFALFVIWFIPFGNLVQMFYKAYTWYIHVLVWLCLLMHIESIW